MKRLIPENMIENWLAEPILINHIIYFDRWSLVHLSIGFLIGYLLRNYKKHHVWLTALTALILYEIIEYLFGGLIFEPEPWLDTFWDVIFGMVGFGVYYLVFGKK